FPLVVVTAALLASSVAHGAAARRDEVSLQTYLSSMSWPVRASAWRAHYAAEAIDRFVSPGDPPFLGQVAASCRKLGEVEARGHLPRVSPPAAPAASHRSLVRAYANAVAACKDARLKALAFRDALERYWGTTKPKDKAKLHRAEAAAHAALPRYARTALRPFVVSVVTWRLAV